MTMYVTVRNIKEVVNCDFKMQKVDVCLLPD